MCELTAWKIGFDRNKGFSAAQKDSIGRIKPNNTLNPWNKIFKVLFPEDPESSYPPPCKFKVSFSSFYYTSTTLCPTASHPPPTHLYPSNTALHRSQGWPACRVLASISRVLDSGVWDNSSTASCKCSVPV